MVAYDLELPRKKSTWILKGYKYTFSNFEKGRGCWEVKNTNPSQQGVFFKKAPDRQWGWQTEYNFEKQIQNEVYLLNSYIFKIASGTIEALAEKTHINGFLCTYHVHKLKITHIFLILMHKISSSNLL
jgi:hypothetical protein